MDAFLSIKGLSFSYHSPEGETEALHKGVLFGLGVQLALAVVVLIQQLLLRLGQPLCEAVAVAAQECGQLLIFSVTAVALLPWGDVAVPEFFEDVVHNVTSLVGMGIL